MTPRLTFDAGNKVPAVKYTMDIHRIAS